MISHSPVAPTYLSADQFSQSEESGADRQTGTAFSSKAPRGEQVKTETSTVQRCADFFEASRLTHLNIGLGSAPKIFVMSQIVLVGPASQNQISVQNPDINTTVCVLLVPTPQFYSFGALETMTSTSENLMRSLKSSHENFFRLQDS